MPNHVHGILWILKPNVVGAQHAAPLPSVAPGSLGAIVRSFKSAVTKRLNELRRTPGTPVWQRNYYERVIRNEDELRRVREVMREHERMVRAFADWNQGVGAPHAAPEPIRVRIGLNAGEPIAEDDPDGRSDLFGTAVIIAARIAAQAKGREILTSDIVRGLVAGKDFSFADRGDVVLRGLGEPVRLYEVRWQEQR